MLTKTDIKILKILARGKTQAEAARELKIRKFKPCSVSHVEKLVKSLKKEYKAKTMFHLGVKLSRAGII